MDRIGREPAGRSGSPAMSAAALALALIPPLAPIGLTLGILALGRRGRGRGLAIAAVAIAPLSILVCLAAALVLPAALSDWRQERTRLAGAQQLRSIGQGMIIYAGRHDDWYPEAGADWRQRLIDAQIISAEQLHSPAAEPGEPSYYYIPGRRFATASEPILYENPDLWDGRGGHVFFDDGRLDWLPGEQYAALFQRLERERAVAERSARSAGGGAVPAASTPAPAASAPPEAVRLISQSMELAEAPRGQPRRARAARGGPSIAVGPMETIVEWRMLLMNQTDQQIEGLALLIEGSGLRQTINAIPPHQSLLPRAPLEVILPVELLPGAMPASLHLSAEVVGVRFADGSGLGDTSTLPPAIAAAPAPAPGAPPSRPAPAGGSGPEISPFADALLVRRSEVTLVEAKYGAGEAWLDVTPAVEGWLADEAWPTPLRVRPDGLGVSDPAPGVVKSLRVQFEVQGAVISAEAEDGQWLLMGGPGSLGLGPVAPDWSVQAGDMRIVAAWYGHMDRWVNVLPKLRDALDDGRIETRAGRGLADMDPAEGVAKNLLLYFERDGAMWQASYPEGAAVRLPLER